MPAFSPWAGGARWTGEESDRVWLCTAERVFALPDRKTAAGGSSAPSLDVEAVDSR
jgi:hypothetical protein